MNNEYKIFVETRSWAGWQKVGKPTTVLKLKDIQDKVKEVTENLDAEVLEFCIMVEIEPVGKTEPKPNIDFSLLASLPRT